MKQLKFLILALPCVFIAKAGNLDEPKNISFIARSDYVKGNADFKQKNEANAINEESLLSYQLTAPNGIREQYLALLKKHIDTDPSQDQNFRKLLIETFVAERIGEVLYNFFEYKKKKDYSNILLDKSPYRDIIQYNTLPTPENVNIEQDTEELKNFKDPDLQRLYQQLIKLFQSYLSEVLNNNILDTYSVLKRERRDASRSTLVIEERTFKILNNYLNLVYKFGVLILTNLPVEMELSVIKLLIADLEKFKQSVSAIRKKDKKFNYNSLETYIKNYQAIIKLVEPLESKLNKLKADLDNADDKTIDELTVILSNYNDLSRLLNVRISLLTSDSTKFTEQQRELLSILINRISNTVSSLKPKVDEIESKVKQLHVTPDVSRTSSTSSTTEPEKPKNLLGSLIDLSSELYNLSARL